VRAILLCLLVGAACTTPLEAPPPGAADGDGAPRSGGVLRLASAEDVRTLDPAKGYDVDSWSFEQMIFSTLVDYGDGTSMVPEVASSWTTTPDGRHVHVQLRGDVRFSTGRQLTAHDVKYSLERVLRPHIHSQGAEFFAGIEGAADYVAGRAPDVRGIVVPAGDRLEFVLVAADPLFLHKLAMPFAAVVDREGVERVGDDNFARHPVGSGPFVLAEWVYGQRLRLARNPFYFRTERPFVDGVELVIGVSDQLAWFKYQRGEIDLTGIPSAEFPRVTTDDRYRPLLMRRATLRTQYIGINCSLPPLDRVPVRQALNLAANRQRLIELIDGRGVPADTILPPEMPGYDATLRPYGFDPADARARLETVGLADGFETTLWATRDPGSLRLAQSLQQDLRSVGVRLAIKPVDFPALLEAIRNPTMVPLFLLGWEADFPDPSNFLTVLLHSRSREANNHTFFASAEVDRLLDAAEPLVDETERLRLFHAAEVRILDEAPWVPLFHPVSVGVRHPRVRNYRLHPLRPARIEDVWLAW